MEVGAYYFWGECFGAYGQHRVVYLVRLCEVLGDDAHEIVFKVIHQGFSDEYGFMKDSEERKVGELCKELLPSKHLEHLHYFVPVDLDERATLKKEKYEAAIRAIRYDKLRFLRRQLTQIIEDKQTAPSTTKESWIELTAIVEQFNDLKLPIDMDDLLFLAEFNNRFEFSEQKNRIRLK